MGYYVNITKSTAFLPKHREAEAYQIMCSLNTTHDHKKTGGSWSGGQQTAKWFSWMDENYPETCKDAGEIFEALGFDIERTDDGIYIRGYDNKAGAEDLFLESIENLMVGEIKWTGEDGEHWDTIFKGDNCIDGEVERNALEYNPQTKGAGEWCHRYY